MLLHFVLNFAVSPFFLLSSTIFFFLLCHLFVDSYVTKFLEDMFIRMALIF